jgi:tRNA(Ile)-lysidine synthase
MAAVEAKGAPWPAAVAVSGGGDSLALMYLLADWARARGRAPPVVLTVDHRLRTGSSRDAKDVVARADAEGLAAHILTWGGAKPAADIEAQARQARYRLMGAWCSKHGYPGLCVAHTVEDQAETFLLRLARGSGIDGLSAMAPVATFPLPQFPNLRVVRPLLGTSRENLRHFLREKQVAWIEDPMNADPRFARVRLRSAWPALERMGLSAPRIALAARHLGRARDALDAKAAHLLEGGCRFEEGIAFIDGMRIARAEREIGLRAFATALMRVAGREYRPRFERLEPLFVDICSGHFKSARTLHGCRIAVAPRRKAVFGPQTLVVTREAGPARTTGARREEPV